MHTRCAPVRHSHAPEGALTVRLACIRPAASVHPEPGSNSSLYYCLSILFSLNLGFRLWMSQRHPLCSLLGSYLGIPSDACAGLRLSKNFLAPGSPLPRPSFLPKAGAKVQPFSKLASTFFEYFLHAPQYADCQLENFTARKDLGGKGHLINIWKAHNHGRNASSMCSITGSPSLKMMEMISNLVSISK